MIRRFACGVVFTVVALIALPVFGAPPLERMRAFHFGGNWLGNFAGIKTLPDNYFQYLANDDVGWLGISVAIHTGGMVDPTVKVTYAPSADSVPWGVYTFDDANLKALITAVRARGIRVYLTLAFEWVPQSQPPDLAALCGTAQYPVPRWLFGETAFDPKSPIESCINPAFWWWNPAHPNSAANVALFWSSYTQVAVKYATLAQQAGVDLFSLGTETDRLFRTRNGQYPSNFRNELKQMVAAVRAAYSGLLSYDQLYEVETAGGFYEGSKLLFQDLGLDVVGVSAYFSLTAPSPTRTLSIPELEADWETVFSRYLVPLRTANPGKPIVFLEFGYTDDLVSPAAPAASDGSPFVFQDGDGNGVDDGREQQRNVYQAFFNVNARYCNLIGGAFLWNNGMPKADFDLTHRGFKLEGKPAELAVRSVYGAWKAMDGPSAPALVTEFYNANLDNFFITADRNEAAAVDSGSAGPGWNRTGCAFPSGGTTPVCRFYGSVSPGPNSHFYTADAAECAVLKQLQASTPVSQPRWNFESNDFSTTPPVNGTCPAGLVSVYRAYNNGFTRGVDSNHRITSSQGAIAEVVNRGWSSEGVVMCTTD